MVWSKYLEIVIIKIIFFELELMKQYEHQRDLPTEVHHKSSEDKQGYKFLSWDSGTVLQILILPVILEN